MNDDFRRLASTQPQWSPDDRNKAKVCFILTDNIRLFLPDGDRVLEEQIDDEGNMELSADQVLEIYRDMCRKVGKSEFHSIEECLRALKSRPYVNIINFIGTKPSCPSHIQNMRQLTLVTLDSI